jgi:hypothetical protein
MRDEGLGGFAYPFRPAPLYTRLGCRPAPLLFEQPMSVDACALLKNAFSRKEVIQPHLPIRLPCYDFTPVTNLTVVTAPLRRLG